MDFEEALLSVYKEKPCQAIPNAFWKTEGLIDNMDTSYESKGKISKLLMRDDDFLHIYWTRDRNSFDLSNEYVCDLTFALIHEDYIDKVPIGGFSDIQRYFRLYSKPTDIVTPDLPKGYRLKEVDIDNETDKISELICRCYENIKPDKDEVMSWKEHPVFDGKLWIWIEDTSNERYAGLGIAELDNRIPEASLEWIQVDPDYHGKGLGKIIVNELIRRVKDKVDLITVGGEYDSEGNPKGFYENCGFTGDDIWYVLRDNS